MWYRKFRYSNGWEDPGGATAFWRAAEANDIAAMRLLISRGADRTIPSSKQVTPLMVAAGIGFQYQHTNAVPDARLDAVKYFVEELGADVNEKDDAGFTVLHGAAYVGDNETIKYLVAKGANVKARSKIRLDLVTDEPEGTGETVADMANGPREKAMLFPETVKYLESLGSEFSDACRSTACITKTRNPKRDHNLEGLNNNSNN